MDLTYNKIQHIFLDSAEQLAEFQDRAVRDAIIYVGNNPLSCDCKLYDFLRYIEGRMHPNVQNYFHIIPENLTCQSPEELKNVPVTHLKSELLMCIVNDTNPDSPCSKKCTCFEKPNDNAFIFDCSRKNLTNIPNDIKNPGNYKQLVLNFTHNQLTGISDLKNLKLESVKKLLLSQNNISEIFLDDIPRAIQVNLYAIFYSKNHLKRKSKFRHK